MLGSSLRVVVVVVAQGVLRAAGHRLPRRSGSTGTAKLRFADPLTASPLAAGQTVTRDPGGLFDGGAVWVKRLGGATARRAGWW
jgi:hypothetical protein